MGNHPVHFKRLSEDTSPPMKVGFDDSHSMSVEMEPLQPENGNNKWHKTYTRFSTHPNRWTCGRFKHRLVIAACFVPILLVLMALIVLSVFKITRISDDSFASKQDISELHILMNESLDNIIQRLDGQSEPTGCNNSYILQMQNQVNAFQEQLKSMQSINVALIGHIDNIQQNLSDLSERAYTLQKHVDTLPRKDSLLELDMDSAHKNVTKLTKKIHRLEGVAANLSSAQLNLESGMKLFHSNVSNAVTHVQNEVSSIRDSQGHVSEMIASLQLNISQLNNQLNAIHGSIQHASSTSQSDASLSDRLSQLESRLNSLSDLIHNPVNLYKNCKEDTVSCSIDRSHTDDYWRECPTEYLPLHKEVCLCTFFYPTCMRKG